MSAGSCQKQLVLDLPVETAMGSADFVVSDSNRQAYEYLVSADAWQGSLTVLWGDAKSGKSHLAGIWARKSGARCLTCGNWPDHLEGNGLVEDADRLWMGETALFNLMNQAMRSGSRVLITARRHPDFWRLRTEDVRSRLRLAHNLEIRAFDDSHLMQLLVKLFDDRQMQVDPALVHYILPRMERSPSFVVNLVESMDALSLERGKPLTRRIVRDALQSLSGSARDRHDAGRVL